MIEVFNVKASCDFGTPVDLAILSRQMWNIVFTSKGPNSSMLIKDPRIGTVQVHPRGSLSIIGAASEADARHALSSVVTRLAKTPTYGSAVSMKNMKIDFVTGKVMYSQGKWKLHNVDEMVGRTHRDVWKPRGVTAVRYLPDTGDKSVVIDITTPEHQTTIRVFEGQSLGVVVQKCEDMKVVQSFVDALYKEVLCQCVRE